MTLDRATMKKLLLLITFTILLLAGVMNIGIVYSALQFIISVFSPIIIGGVIAFILNVPMRSLEKLFFSSLAKRRKDKKMPGYARPVSMLLTIALVVLTLLIVILIVLPQLAETVSGLGVTISAGINNLIAWGLEQFSANPQVVEWLRGLTFNWDKIIDTVFSFLRSGAGNFLSSTVTAVSALVSGVGTFVISLVFAIYFLLQKEKLSLACRKAILALLPRRAAVNFLEVCALSERIFSSFITGQCIEAVILGTMFFVVMTIFSMPYALLISCLIAVTALIPIVGAFIGCAVGVFLILFISPVKALTFLVVFLVLQQVEGNLIYPHVVGGSIGLPSIWVLGAVTVGGSLMGVAGMLLFIPLVSVLYTLFRRYVYRRLDEKHITVK